MLSLRLHPAPYGKDQSETVYLKTNNKVEAKGLNHKILKLDNVEDRHSMKSWQRISKIEYNETIMITVTKVSLDVSREWRQIWVSHDSHAYHFATKKSIL